MKARSRERRMLEHRLRGTDDLRSPQCKGIRVRRLLWHNGRRQAARDHIAAFVGDNYSMKELCDAVFGFQCRLHQVRGHVFAARLQIVVVFRSACRVNQSWCSAERSGL
jgi:hypothetical protein